MEKRTMEGLTLADAALLYCILGAPDPLDHSKRRYPTVAEALAYMQGGGKNAKEEKEESELVIYEQLTLL